MERVSVLVADDHPLFREAIVRAVGEHPEFSLAGEAEDGRAALDAIREPSPEVASRPGEGTLVRVSIPLHSSVSA